MSFKIAFIGAGSIGFTRGLLRDLLSYCIVKKLPLTIIAFSAVKMKRLGISNTKAQMGFRQT